MKRATLIVLSCIFLLIGGLHAVGAKCGYQPQEQRIKIVPKEGQQDLVDIRFRINTQGKVQVLSVVASDANLVDYVINKLLAIELSPNDEDLNRVYRYKFRFNDQI